MFGFFRGYVRWKTALMVCCTCALCAGYALAVESDAPSASEVDNTPVSVDTSSDDRQIVVNVEIQNDTPVLEAPGPGDTSDDSELLTASLASYSTISLDSFPEGDEETPNSDTVRGALTSLFGSYTPRTQTVTQHLADGSAVSYQEYVSGVAGMDWDWLCGVGIFALMLFCLFRFMGGVFKYG